MEDEYGVCGYCGSPLSEKEEELGLCAEDCWHEMNCTDDQCDCAQMFC